MAFSLPLSLFLSRSLFLSFSLSLSLSFFLSLSLFHLLWSTRGLEVNFVLSVIYAATRKEDEREAGPG
jgi:hypothetical protein